MKFEVKLCEVINLMCGEGISNPFSRIGLFPLFAWVVKGIRNPFSSFLYIARRASPAARCRS